MRILQYLFMTLAALFLAVPAFAQTSGGGASGGGGLISLAAALGTRSRFRVPAWLLKLVFGDMAREAILASCRVLPGKLNSAGFSPRHRSLESMLELLYRQ